jgi:hypothetical protein
MNPRWLLVLGWLRGWARPDGAGAAAFSACRAAPQAHPARALTSSVRIRPLIDPS